MNEGYIGLRQSALRKIFVRIKVGMPRRLWLSPSAERKVDEQISHFGDKEQKRRIIQALEIIPTQLQSKIGEKLIPLFQKLDSKKEYWLCTVPTIDQPIALTIDGNLGVVQEASKGSFLVFHLISGVKPIEFPLDPKEVRIDLIRENKEFLLKLSLYGEFFTDEDIMDYGVVENRVKGIRSSLAFEDRMIDAIRKKAQSGEALLPLFDKGLGKSWEELYEGLRVIWKKYGAKFDWSTIEPSDFDRVKGFSLYVESERYKEKIKSGEILPILDDEKRIRTLPIEDGIIQKAREKGGLVSAEDLETVFFARTRKEARDSARQIVSLLSVKNALKPTLKDKWTKPWHADEFEIIDLKRLGQIFSDANDEFERIRAELEGLWEKGVKLGSYRLLKSDLDQYFKEYKDLTIEGCRDLGKVPLKHMEDDLRKVYLKIFDFYERTLGIDPMREPPDLSKIEAEADDFEKYPLKMRVEAIHKFIGESNKLLREFEKKKEDLLIDKDIKLRTLVRKAFEDERIDEKIQNARELLSYVRRNDFQTQVNKIEKSFEAIEEFKGKCSQYWDGLKSRIKTVKREYTENKLFLDPDEAEKILSITQRMEKLKEDSTQYADTIENLVKYVESFVEEINRFEEHIKQKTEEHKEKVGYALESVDNQIEILKKIATKAKMDISNIIALRSKIEQKKNYGEKLHTCELLAKEIEDKGVKICESKIVWKKYQEIFQKGSIEVDSAREIKQLEGLKRMGIIEITPVTKYKVTVRK